jgi:hypothetical protein
MLIGILNLAHCRRASPNAAAHIDVSAVSQEREDERGDKGSPPEPEEGSRGLGFAATLLGIGGAICDVVCAGVIL